MLSVFTNLLGGFSGSPHIEVLFSPEQGEQILRKLTDTIRNAEKRVYVLIFSFTLDEIAETLIEKHGQGLDVKIIMDKGQGSLRWVVTEKLRRTEVSLVINAGSKGGIHAHQGINRR